MLTREKDMLVSFPMHNYTNKLINHASTHIDKMKDNIVSQRSYHIYLID